MTNPRIYLPTPQNLERLSDAQKEFYAEYYEAASNFFAVIALLEPGGRLYKGLPKWVLKMIGKKAAKGSPTADDIAKAYRDAIGKSSSPDAQQQSDDPDE
jgi:hypothetical protein